MIVCFAVIGSFSDPVAAVQRVEVLVEPGTNAGVGFGLFEEATILELTLKVKDAAKYKIQDTQCTDQPGAYIYQRISATDTQHVWKIYGVLPNFINGESHASIYHGTLSPIGPGGGPGTLPEFDAKVCDIDLDCDSDNDSAAPHRPPSHSAEEDNCEDNRDALASDDPGGMLMGKNEDWVELKLSLNAKRPGTLTISAYPGGVAVIKESDGSALQGSRGIIEGTHNLSFRLSVDPTANNGDSTRISAVFTATGGSGSAQDRVRVKVSDLSCLLEVKNTSIDTDDVVGLESQASAKTPMRVKLAPPVAEFTKLYEVTLSDRDAGDDDGQVNFYDTEANNKVTMGKVEQEGGGFVHIREVPVRIGGNTRGKTKIKANVDDASVADGYAKVSVIQIDTFEVFEKDQWIGGTREDTTDSMATPAFPQNTVFVYEDGDKGLVEMKESHTPGYTAYHSDNDIEKQLLWRVVRDDDGAPTNWDVTTSDFDFFNQIYPTWTNPGPAGTNRLFRMYMGVDADGEGVLDISNEAARRLRIAIIYTQDTRATMNGQSRQSTSRDKSFVQNVPVAITQAAGTFTLELRGFLPNDHAIIGLVQWTVMQNTDDTNWVDENPTLTPNATTKTLATLNTNAWGSFNVIAYIDRDSSGAYFFDEQLKVLSVAMVKIDLIKNTVNKGTIGGHKTATRTHFTSNVPISYDLEVVLKGGGQDARIGASKIHAGIVGKQLVDLPTASYKNDKTSPLVFVTPKPAAGWFDNWQGLTQYNRALLDTARANPATGGATVFRASSSEGTRTAPQGGGYKETITATDQPLNWFLTRWRAQAGGSLIDSSDGGFVFNDYLAAYSTDFDRSYSAWAQCDWSILWRWKDDAGTWKDNGSSLTVPTSMTTTNFPTSAADAQMELRTPVPNDTMAADYTEN